MDISPIFYKHKSSLPWLKERTVFLTRHGSWAYGTNIETSDEDFKGVAIPPKSYFHGFHKRFEQAECNEPDAVIYDIRKLMALAANCNPNVIEVLFTDSSDHVVVTPLGQKLLDNKEKFLSKKVKHTFAGYAHSQARRMEGHWRMLHNPPSHQPSRGEFGLPDKAGFKAQMETAHAAIQKQLDRWSFKDLEHVDPAARISLIASMTEALAEIKVGADEQYRAAGRLLGFDDNLLALLDKERTYRNKMSEWTQYQTWVKNRNPKRAEIEKKIGYDSKNALHLVRLQKMCREILATGQVLVKRPDREELIAIRNGAWKYEDLIAWAQKQDEELSELYKTSPLPDAPDRVFLDNLCCEIVEESFR